jgi:hypothetical protein
MADHIAGQDFDELYRDEQSVDGLPALTPWDIGKPQPVVQQLVAYGALKGEVLDPGTGPAITRFHFASKGYATTGIDSSAAAIDRAKRNAQRAGAIVEFRVADATRSMGSRIGSTPSPTCRGCAAEDIAESDGAAAGPAWRDRAVAGKPLDSHAVLGRGGDARPVRTLSIAEQAAAGAAWLTSKSMI